MQRPTTMVKIPYVKSLYLLDKFLRAAVILKVMSKKDWSFLSLNELSKASQKKAK